MPTIDDVRREWDEHLKETSEALFVLERAHRSTKEQIDKASKEQLDAVLGYWKFKRVMEHAIEQDADNPQRD